MRNRWRVQLAASRPSIWHVCSRGDVRNRWHVGAEAHCHRFRTFHPAETCTNNGALEPEAHRHCFCTFHAVRTCANDGTFNWRHLPSIWHVLQQHRVDVVDAQRERLASTASMMCSLEKSYQVKPSSSLRMPTLDCRIARIAPAGVRGKGLAQQALAGAAAVDVGDVERVDALVERRLDQLCDLGHAHLVDAHETHHNPRRPWSLPAQTRCSA